MGKIAGKSNRVKKKKVKLKKDEMRDTFLFQKLLLSARGDCQVVNGDEKTVCKYLIIFQSWMEQRCTLSYSPKN